MLEVIEEEDRSGSLVSTVNNAPFIADPETLEAQEVVDSVRRACTTSGFFQVSGPGLLERQQRDLFRALQNFFTLSLQEKNKVDIRTTIGRRGYDALASQSCHADALPDLKEGFFIGQDVPLDDPNVQARRFFMGPNVWPDASVLAPQDFRAPVEAYFHAVHSLALKVLDLVVRILPYGAGIFDEFTAGQTVAVLRMLRYLEGPKQLGAGAHTDFGAISLLLQDEQPGLEFLDPKTNEFVAVNPTPNALVFNAGDTLSVWTGGEFKSSVHRVVNKAPMDRYSAAFYYDGSLDCPLTPFDRKSPLFEGEETLTVEKHLILAMPPVERVDRILMKGCFCVGFGRVRLGFLITS